MGNAWAREISRPVGMVIANVLKGKGSRELVWDGEGLRGQKKLFRNQQVAGSIPAVGSST